MRKIGGMQIYVAREGGQKNTGVRYIPRPRYLLVLTTLLMLLLHYVQGLP